MKIVNKKNIFLIILVFIAGCFFYFHNRAYYSRGEYEGTKKIAIEKGESIFDIGEKLESEKLISGDKYFVYYFLIKGIQKDIKAGEFRISANLTIPEIANILTEEDAGIVEVKITFPEGWTSKEMADRLDNNAFSGKDFLEAVADPQDEFIAEYVDFLPKGESLEGYLFPDTYLFTEDADDEEIIGKMLENFDIKLSEELRREIKKQGKTIHEAITMASVLEGEVKTEEDRKIVSGIFWKRISEERPLQSCATIAYALGEKKKQYSFEDTRVDSPYNTYINKGLPPGPVNNPGIVSIRAAIYPTETDYYYFLSDPETGKTVFSRTIEEHNANKDKYGL